MNESQEYDAAYNEICLYHDMSMDNKEATRSLFTLLNYIHQLEQRLNYVASTVPPDYFRPIGS